MEALDLADRDRQRGEIGAFLGAHVLDDLADTRDRRAVRLEPARQCRARCLLAAPAQYPVENRALLASEILAQRIACYRLPAPVDGEGPRIVLSWETEDGKE